METANVGIKVAETQPFLLAIYQMTSAEVLMANLDCKLNLRNLICLRECTDMEVRKLDKLKDYRITLFGKSVSES